MIASTAEYGILIVVRELKWGGDFEVPGLRVRWHCLILCARSRYDPRRHVQNIDKLGLNRSVAVHRWYEGLIECSRHHGHSLEVMGSDTIGSSRRWLEPEVRRSRAISRRHVGTICAWSLELE